MRCMGRTLSGLCAFLCVWVAGEAIAQTSRASNASRVVVYASVGPDLTWYEMDVEHVTLVKRGSVSLPANVQEACAHPSKQYLYVVWSDTANPSARSDGPQIRSGVSAFTIDRGSGVLHPYGEPIKLPSRPIHVTTDARGAHLLIAYNNPSGVTVHRIGPNGAIGTEVKPPASLDVGVYAHQVRVDPSNTNVFLVTRGNGPAGSRPEDPGALKVFRYSDGVLTQRASIAPQRGFNFQPRHLDFHPSRPWVFVSLERQNQLQVYKKESGETLSREPLFTKGTLAVGDNSQQGQAVGTVHVHPSGRFVYVANRASGTTAFEGKQVLVGGENSIAVYRVNPDTGEPVRLQNIDTRGIHPRTFALDHSGRILVAANLMSLSVRQANGVTLVPASLALFRVGADGRLEFVGKHDVETDSTRSLFWMGVVSWP